MVTKENGHRRINSRSFEDVIIEIPIEPIVPNTNTQRLRPTRNFRSPEVSKLISGTKFKNEGDEQEGLTQIRTKLTQFKHQI